MKRACAVEKIIQKLKAEGWEEQRSGTIYINGTLGTNLLRNGEVITVSQDFFADQEFLDQEWGDE